MYTLTLVFDKELSHVLMCFHEKFNKYNFIGSKVEYMELDSDASYRELYEETGIEPDKIDLKFVELETTTSSAKGLGLWSMYITAGILNEDVELKPEKNSLTWVDINDTQFFLNAFGQGNCYTYLRRALYVLTGDARYLE